MKVEELIGHSNGRMVPRRGEIYRARADVRAEHEACFSSITAGDTRTG